MRSSVLLVSSLAVLAAALGCERSGAAPSRQNTAAAVPAAPRVPDGPTAPTSPVADVPWIEDDFSRAQQDALSSSRPIVIDMWASWCHTCLSMRQTVLRDPAVTALAERFVWLAVDTEAAVNAPLLAALPVHVWPTFYVVSPRDKAIQASQLGATSAREFAEFLLRGERGHLASLDSSGQLEPNTPLWYLRAADRAAGRGNDREAAESYAAALAAAPSDWDRRGEVLVAHIAALWRSEQKERCAELADREIDAAAAALNATTADFAYWSNKCAVSLSSPERATQLRQRAIRAVESVLASDRAELSIDDRSEALGILQTLASDSGDREAASAYALRQRVLLDRAVVAAESGLEQLTYVYHRTGLYAELGIGQELVPWLEAMTAALPDQYDPPYRLAWLHKQLGDTDAALASAQIALDRVYGPRKARVQLLIAQIHDERADRAAASAARNAALATMVALPAGQRSAKLEEKIRKELATSQPAM